jgi:hypothetical protein
VDQHPQLVQRLDPLGADHGAGAAREVDERADQRNLGGVGVHVRHQGPVELDDVGPHAHHLLEAGVALPRVVHGDARAAGAQRVEVALEPLHVEDPLFLRDLEHDAAQVARQALPDVRGRQRRRAQVDRQERARRAVVRRHRGAHRLHLERGAQPEAVRLREPPGRRQAGLALEARQRLVADRLAAGQRHDRLEHRSYGLWPRDQGGEVLALLLGDDQDPLGVVAARPSASALLGPLQRAAGELQQRAGALRVIGVAGDPGRAAQRAADRRGHLHGRAGRFGQRERALAVGVRQHEPELVAAHARDHPDVPHGGAEAFGGAGEQLVAIGMTARLVHALEVVDVEQHDGERLPAGARRVELAGERLLEAAVVRQLGQGVAVHQLLEGALVLLQVRGHRVELACQLTQLVAAAPAEAGAEVAGADRPRRGAQLGERAEDPASEDEGHKRQRTHRQDSQRNQHAPVAVVEPLLRWTHVVGERERAPSLDPRDQSLGIAGRVSDRLVGAAGLAKGGRLQLRVVAHQGAQVPLSVLEARGRGAQRRAGGIAVGPAQLAPGGLAGDVDARAGDDEHHDGDLKAEGANHHFCIGGSPTRFTSGAAK